MSHNIDFIDPFGLAWTYERDPDHFSATATGDCDDTIDELARQTGLNPKTFRFWMLALDGKRFPKDEHERLGSKRSFLIPNTIVVGVGNVSWLQRKLIGSTPLQAHNILRSKGFHSEFYDWRQEPWKSSDITGKRSYELYGIVCFGHGGATTKWGKAFLLFRGILTGQFDIEHRGDDGGEWLYASNFSSPPGQLA